MFESLHPPTDLASARARLRALADGRVAATADADGSVTWLGRPDTGRVGPGPGVDLDWPHIDPAAVAVVADTVLWRATWAQLRRLSEGIDPHQRLLFLEPTADVGWRRAVHRAGRPLWLATRGHHFERDIPAELRASGLQLCELTRFGIGTGDVWSYALGEMARIR